MESRRLIDGSVQWTTPFDMINVVTRFSSIKGFTAPRAPGDDVARRADSGCRCRHMWCYWKELTPGHRPGGSIDIYFGPEQPDGVADANFIKTIRIPDRNFLAALRLFGTEVEFFDQSWKSDDLVKLPWTVRTRRNSKQQRA